MRTLVVASRKGGAGKSTLSAHLGVAAELNGDGPVAFIDLDEQGSLADWWNVRAAETPLFTRVAVSGLKSHLSKLKEGGIKLVVIDTPPGLAEDTRLIITAALACADLVLIPTRPSPIDLRAIGATISLVEDAKKRMVFVITGAANRASITGKTAVALSQHGTVCPTVIYQRTNFGEVMADGGTVLEGEPEGKSASEIKDLWKYVSTQINK
jgi:chromosome partitioning protein